MRKLAVIGHPVAHSLSPLMHNFISDYMNHDFVYSAVDVLPGEVCAAAARLKREFSGFNVTAPHKVEIMKCIDEISEEAAAYGAVNTVVNHGGKLVGYNTDADGFLRSLAYEEVNIRNADVLILGAGGAAQPIAMKLSKSGVRSITVSNRTAEKSQLIRRRTMEYSGFSVETEINRRRYDIIINCTSLGMGKNIGISPLSDMSLADCRTVCIDLIYNPSETAFLHECRKVGARTVNGLGMLIFQGIAAYELFSDAILPGDIAGRLFQLLTANERNGQI